MSNFWQSCELSHPLQIHPPGLLEQQWQAEHKFYSRSLDKVPFLFNFKGVNQIDNDLKARASAYNNLKGNLQNLERKNA